VSPYMSGFHVFADFEMGDATDALANIRKEWGYMLNRDPGGVFWERIENSGLPGRGLFSDSAAHAWSTGPTVALSKYVLGVAPKTGGFRQWSVAPQVGDLAWAQGVVPTPRGSISVRWLHNGGSFALTVKGPKRGSGLVTIPGARHSTIARNGRIVWMHGKRAPHVRARAMGRDVVFTQGGGSATYAFAGKGGGKKGHKGHKK